MEFCTHRASALTDFSAGARSPFQNVELYMGVSNTDVQRMGRKSPRAASPAMGQSPFHHLGSGEHTGASLDTGGYEVFC